MMTESYCDITAILLVLDAFTLDFGLPKVLVACCFCNLPSAVANAPLTYLFSYTNTDISFRLCIVHVSVDYYQHPLTYPSRIFRSMAVIIFKKGTVNVLLAPYLFTCCLFI